MSVYPALIESVYYEEAFHKPFIDKLKLYGGKRLLA
jgi:hypothetical protein